MILGALLVGCVSVDTEHFELGMRLLPPTVPDATIVLRSADLEVQGLRLHACDNPDLGWIRGFPADERPRHLLLPADPTLQREPRTRGVELPAGSWCAIDAFVAANLSVDLTAGSTDIVLNLELGDFLFEATLPFGEQGGTKRRPTRPRDVMLVLGQPEWLSPVVPLLGDAVLKVAAGTDVHDELVATVREGTALYFTDDADGAITDDELAAGSIGIPAP
jgi:hypothetical protein